jgi:hypothetical protein
MPLAILLNPDDPLFEFEHMMQHREYFAVMDPLPRFSALPYQLASPRLDVGRPAGDWNLRHQRAHNDFNRTLPSNYLDGYTLSTVTPIPPPTPPPPPFDQATATDAGQFGVLPEHNLLEGTGPNSEDRSWWTFVNHQEHYEANNAILPLPTTAATSAGTGPGEANLSNPWWWTNRAPIQFPYW